MFCLTGCIESSNMQENVKTISGNITKTYFLDDHKTLVVEFKDQNPIKFKGSYLQDLFNFIGDNIGQNISIAYYSNYGSNQIVNYYIN